MLNHPPQLPADDPRRLRNLLSRAREFASGHSMPSVVVGLAGFEGDPVFPEVVEYVVSSLRIDDGVFRMTRERAVLLLTDVDALRAERIMERVLSEFREHFPSLSGPAVALGYFPVDPAAAEVTVREVLPEIFASQPRSH